MKKLLDFWMATDKDGLTWLYDNKPKKYEDCFSFQEINEKFLFNKNGSYFIGKNINNQTFEDEPIKVSLIIEGK